MKKSTSKKKKKVTKKASPKKKKLSPKKKSGSKMEKSIDFKLIKKTNEFMQDEGIEELEYRIPNLEIKLKKFSRSSSVPSQSAENNPPAPMPQAVAPALKTTEAPAAVVTNNANIKSIKSPFVGTYYKSPSPNDPPFVEEGSLVKVGDTLCIVEAMKLMNEIESEWKGRIVKVYMDDSSPVEYGEKLFDLELI